MKIFKVHIISSFNINEKDFDRLFEEFLSYFGETAEQFIMKRHLQLRDKGMKNEDIYLKLLDEIKFIRFKSPELSPRQIRRIIYG